MKKKGMLLLRSEDGQWSMSGPRGFCPEIWVDKAGIWWAGECRGEPIIGPFHSMDALITEIYSGMDEIDYD